MAGGPIQSSFNLINHLKDHYDFSVITRDTDYTDIVPYKNIKSDSWNILPNGMRVYYFSTKNINYANIAKLISEEEFDIAYLNSMYSPRFTIIPLLILSKLKKKIMLAPRGMLAPSAIAIKSWKKKPFLLWMKNSNMIKHITFHAASVQEKEHIINAFGDKAEIKLAPNLPHKMELPPKTERKKEPGFVHLISIARISPEKNLLFALEVLRKVKGKVKFDAYGPVYDYNYWEKCKSLISKMPLNIEVEHLGPIAKEDIPGKFKDVHFLFLPTQGENFGHTILEAMIYGAPAIISDQTPWRGLEKVKAGWDLSLEKQADFVSIIEKTIAMDSKEFNQWSDSSRDFAYRFVNDPSLLQQSVDLFA